MAEQSLRFKHLQEALIFDIKHNSLEDGPGIRSVVFFKGCPLNCQWCQNPEGKEHTRELWWDEKKCIADGACIEICPQDAISFEFPEFINRDLCDNCFRCVDVCPSTALKVTAISMSVDDIISQILPYKNYFATSGGGVTLSGGEATLHMKFVSILLQRLKALGIHTLIETSGYFDYQTFEELILPYVDEVFYDIKFIDPHKHKQWCGVDNHLILDNFKLLHKRSLIQNFKLLPRTALITNITDTEENIRSIALFYKSLSVKKTTLLPNNPTWLHKLDSLGTTNETSLVGKLKSLYPVDRYEGIRNYFLEFDIQVDFG